MDEGAEASDISGLARRGILSLGGAGVSAVANLLLIVAVTRATGKETAGYLFSSTSLFIVLEGLCALGTATGVVYFIARSRALKQGHLVRPTLRTALGPVVLVSLVAALAMFLLAPVAGEALGADSPQPVLFLRILALFLPFAVVYDVLIAATQGFHTMTPTVLLEKVGRPVLQLLLLVLALTVGAAWLLPVAWMGPYLLGLLGVAFALRRLLRRNDRDSPKQLAGAEAPAGIDRRAFWAFTAPRGLAAVAQLSLQRLDIVLVAIYLGAGPAAVYTAATRFVVLGQLGSQAVALAVQPKLSELMAREEIAATRRVYKTSTAWVVAVTWPVHLIVAMLSPLLMQLFGRGYGDGQPVIVLLAGAMLVATSCGMVTMLLLMSGRSRENLLNVLVALVTNLSLNVVLIPRMGIMGAAIAWAVAIVLSNLLPLVQVHRAFDLDPFGTGTVRVGALALACFTLLPGAAWLASGEAPMVIGAVAVGCIAYGLGLFALRRVLELDDLVQSIRRKASSG
ncbi:MAG TPA: oligosaccharide flippase family protein [Nocardioidaceae bacterium]|nr:oligosaccharide flippase family protein [Nocardioidaceae bacterium]